MAERPSPEPAIDPSARIWDCRLWDCRLGRGTGIGARTRMSETVPGDHSRIVADGGVIRAEIGTFCSIAAAVRLKPGDPRIDATAPQTVGAEGYGGFGLPVVTR